MQNGSVDIIMTIPPQFEKDFLKNRSGEIQLLINAINGQQATVGASYLTAIIQSFNREIRADAAPQFIVQRQNPSPRIDIESSNWFNPELDFKYFMAPGIMGELVTILVMLLTAMNIVREREIGTIEQINVTPIKKWQFILGKMVPFLIIGLVTTFFFVIIFILMSGLFTPIERMPQWAQYLTIPNPIAHFVHVMRSVLLKGSTFSDVAYNFQVTAILAVVFNMLGLWSYRK